MKQNQKQYVNVIINQDKPKRRKRRTKKQPTNENNILKDNKPNPSNVAYNPNTLSTTRVPSYGLASINPTLTEHPLLSNISETLKNLEPKMTDYTKLFNDIITNRQNNTLSRDDIRDIINNTLHSQGREFINNYLQDNNGILSRAESYTQSEVDEIDLENEPFLQEPITEQPQPTQEQSPQPTQTDENTGVLTRTEKSKILERIKELRVEGIIKKRKGRPPNNEIELKTELEYNIKRIQDVLTKLTERKRTESNKKKIEKLSEQISELTTLKNKL